jgi:hypothetical protein
MEMTIKRGLKRLCVVISVPLMGLIVLGALNSAWEGVLWAALFIAICWAIYWVLSGFFEDKKNDNETDE